MLERQARNPLVEIPRRVFGESAPTQIPEILRWIDHNPEEFRGMLATFDEVIQDFNRRTPNQVDESYQNFHMIKRILGKQELPTVNSLLTETGLIPLMQYGRVVKSIKQMMFRGQMPKDERIEPWVGYHQTKTTPRNLVIASIFHTYEDVVKSKDRFDDKEFESDRIIEALMEIAAEHPDSGLFSALASKTSMDWVDNYDRFTPEFRQKNGFN